jgi:hypothetical protein
MRLLLASATRLDYWRRVKRRRRDKDHPETIDAILARAGESRFAPRQAPISIVHWREAVGPRIADQTVPVSLEGGTLLVRTRSSTWASELSMLSETILIRLRHMGVKVERLVFRTGKVELPHRPVERRQTRQVPPPAPLPSILRRELDGVADEELRESIRDAAARSIAIAANVSPRDARDPRVSGTKNAPPAQGSSADREAPPRNRAGDRGRSR